MDAASFRLFADVIQQHCFADTAQAHEQEAFCRKTQTRALQGDTSSLNKFVAASQLRRRRAGTGGIGV